MKDGIYGHIQFLNLLIEILILGLTKEILIELIMVCFLTGKILEEKNQLLRIKSRFGFKEHYQIMYDIPYVNDKKTFGIKTNIEYFRRKITFFNTTNNRLDYYSDSINNNYTSKDFHFSVNFSLRKNIYATHNLNLSYFQTEIDKQISNLNESI